MPITPAQPITLDKVYDAYWITNLRVLAPVVNGEANGVISLIPYISATGEKAPQELAISIPVNGIFAKIAAGDTDLAGIMQSILSYAQAHLPS